MELKLQYKIKKNECERIPIPNLRGNYLLPTKIMVSVQEIDFTLIQANNPLVRYGEPYFKIFNYIDLSDFMNKIAEGDDLVMSIKNSGKRELELEITILFEKHEGNVIFSNSYHYNQPNLERCLEDIYAAGQITRLIIDAERPISSVVFDPLYKSETTIGLDNWSTLSIENPAPENQMTIDFTESELESYAKYLKFYRLKIAFVGEDAKNEPAKINLLGFGYKR